MYRTYMILIGLMQSVAYPLFADDADNDVLIYRQWISEMKGLGRGPFSRLRWFCNDGTIFPPQTYACKDHGGGYQHGEWSDKTLKLRQQGYLVVNIALAGFDHLIPLDVVIVAMAEVGKQMTRELCCTGLGGIAICPSSKALELRLK